MDEGANNKEATPLSSDLAPSQGVWGGGRSTARDLHFSIGIGLRRRTPHLVPPSTKYAAVSS